MKRLFAAMALCLFAVLTLCRFAAPAHADELRPGYLELTQRDARHWQVVWKAPLLGGLARRAHPVFPAFCAFNAAAARLDGGALITAGILDCARSLAGSEVGLSGMAGSYDDALVRVAPLDRPVQAERLTAARPRIVVAVRPDGWQVARTYFQLGVSHILTGWDHLLFVIALVLLLRRGGIVVRAATAFTIAHSLTLIGTTLGLIGLAQAPVEALIALSIVFLAVEIAKQREGSPRLSERVPWVVAFLFGLLHGFGFAGALREIGLPESDVPAALLTFNFGVEAGQLVIIAAVLAGITLVRRFAAPALRPAIVGASYAIGTAASSWFFARVLG